MDRPVCLDGPAPADLLLSISPDDRRVRRADLVPALAVDGQVHRAADALPQRPADRDVLILGHGMAPPAPDRERFISADLRLHVPLRALKEALRPGTILEGQLVETLRPRRAPAPPYGLGRAGRQGIRRRVVGVRRATDDDRLVGVAFEKTDEHLLSDAGQGPEAEARAGPSLAYPDPARALLVARRRAIPEEASPNAAMLIGEQLFARGAGDDRTLQTVHGGPRCAARRAIGLVGEHGFRASVPFRVALTVDRELGHEQARGSRPGAGVDGPGSRRPSPARDRRRWWRRRPRWPPRARPRASAPHGARPRGDRALRCRADRRWA